MTVARRPLAHGLDDELHLTPEERTALLGAKGAGLQRMLALGMPVPPGFTITTVACHRYLAHGWDDELDAAVREHLGRLEAATALRLGDPASPLLVSVRSGAAVSMPGMLDTVLDVGMTDAIAAALAERTGDVAFARDTRARADRSWAAVVGADRPADPHQQVLAAVRAVFDSWTGVRARHYRQVEAIDDSLGTAVTVQAMVFGNRDARSGTGVVFSRDPSTGIPGPVGDFLVRAQGDDVVGGTHRTEPLSALARHQPRLWDELVALLEQLEHELDDAVDVEFTVEEGRLWILQARRAKRSTLAELRIAVDLAADPTFDLDRAGAVERCRHLLDAEHGHGPSGPGAGGRADGPVVVRGLPAVPGRAVGVLCCDVDRAVELEAAGVDVILVRRETSPADVHGMAASRGLVTALGGLVSHAAVVARSWGLPAVVGAGELRFVPGGVDGPGGHVEEGEVVTVDGDAGCLRRGAHPAQRSQPPAELEVLRRWAAAAG